MFKGTATLVNARRFCLTVETNNGKIFFVQLRDSTKNYAIITNEVEGYSETDRVKCKLIEKMKFIHIVNQTLQQTHKLSVKEILPGNIFSETTTFVEANRGCVTVEDQSGIFYWVHLNESKGNYNTIGEGVWKYKKSDTVEAELTTNKKFLLLRNRTSGKTHSLSISHITPAGEMYVNSIIGKREHQARVKEFHVFLKSLGLEFKLDYPHYMDDYASLIVWHKGKIVFNGQSIDLNNRSEGR